MLIPSEIDKKFSQLAAQRQANKDAPAHFTSDAPTPAHDAARAAAQDQDHEHTSLCFGDDDDGEYPPEDPKPDGDGEDQDQADDVATAGVKKRLRPILATDHLSNGYPEPGPPPIPADHRRPVIREGEYRRTGDYGAPHAPHLVPDGPMKASDINRGPLADGHAANSPGWEPPRETYFPPRSAELPPPSGEGVFPLHTRNGHPPERDGKC
jgi:hypothetical protein